MLISTLEALFLGRAELFQGLAIAKMGYDFKSYPVIRLDLSKFANDNETVFQAELHREFDKIEGKHQLPLTAHDLPVPTRLGSILEGLGEAVLLVDEYDKPILDHISDPTAAGKNRNLIRNLLGVIKTADEYLRFVFITGVTRFTKVSIFSDLNSLEDISMSPDYADLVGFNEQELAESLGPYINELATKSEKGVVQVVEELRSRYNGYRFSSDPGKVYNPWSLLNTFKTNVFKDYWFASGTPSFLLRLIKKDSGFHIKQLQGVVVSDATLDSFDLDRLNLIPLLFQSGYLTIVDHRQDQNGTSYLLGYPNDEVERALANYLLLGLTGREGGEAIKLLPQLVEALEGGDLGRFFSIISRDFFSELPYDLQIPLEKYYTSIFHVIFILMGTHAKAEEKTNVGRIDEIVEVGDRIYIFEFKYMGSVEKALNQIQNKNYAQKFAKTGKTIVPVGVNIKKGGIVDYKMGELEIEA